MINKSIFATILVLFVYIEFSYSFNSTLDSTDPRNEKVLSIFNIVRFRNEPCTASTGTRNGTCYTAQECENREGTASGTCAEGYGVCCTFPLTCGSSSTENCTYFESGTQALAAGDCTAQICRINENVCMLRLDFDMFTISGPATQAGVIKTAFGVPNDAGTGTNSARGACNTDSFSALNPSGASPPTVCGTLTGDHMYVDASNPCNPLQFLFGGTVQTGVTRQFSIKITQVNCNAVDLPPPGCTQYFTATSGTIQSFNFNNGMSRHLAGQNQNICIRRNRGSCAVCYSVGMNQMDFMLTKNMGEGTGMHNKFSDTCCNFKTIKGEKGFDCVIIPSASKQNKANNLAGGMVGASAFCGNKLITKTALKTVNTTVCSRREPFSIRFISNAFEHSVKEATGNQGFRLDYFQTPC